MDDAQAVNVERADVAPARQWLGLRPPVSKEVIEMPGTVAFGFGEHGDRGSISVPVPLTEQEDKAGYPLRDVPQQTSPSPRGLQRDRKSAQFTSSRLKPGQP
jgi:hypothetical protein